MTMESGKKWLSERISKKNGLYVHYSPPKFLGTVTASELRRWASSGCDVRLERAVLAGQGRRLLAAAAELAPAPLAAMQARCTALHTAVERGSLLQLQELLDTEYNRRKFANCRDEAGVGLLHKAVFYDFTDIVQYLVSNYPQLVHQRDSEGRTPLHYAAASRNEAEIASLLETAGAMKAARDAAGHTPAFYRGSARAMLSLPTVEPAPLEGKDQGLVVKRHNIRIWCHDCDMARLQRVVWDGHGSKLLSEVSNQPIVRKFLEAVPYIMNTIRDIHNAVVQNDLEGVMRLTADPVPPQALSSRDSHNMTAMHKAAGLGHVSILKYIADRFPQGINDVDNDGRTPLHYAATVRDEQHTYNTLLGLGADESIVDNKNKTPGYYINRPQDIDKNIFKTVPEAPRTPSSTYPSSWDWKILDTEMIAEFNKKTRRKNVKTSNENISAKNNTNTLSESTQNNSNVMKNSSTQEHIESLPELDDNHRTNENGVELYDVESSKETGAEDESREPEVEEITENNHDNVENNEPEVVEHPDDNEMQNYTHENESDHNQSKEIEDKEDHNINNTVDNSTSAQIEDGHDEHSDKNETLQTDDINQASNTRNITTNNEDTKNEETHSIDGQGEPEENENISLEPNQHEISESHQKNEASELDREENLSVDKEAEEDAKVVAELSIHNNKLNDNTGLTEDDDDVQVHGDTQSEYSDTYLKSTAEASSKPGSAERENKITDDGRNTQQSLIEGVINGYAEEDYQDASVIREGSIQGDIYIVDNEIDPEVTELINSTNMEMLATLVLNGEGSRLVGRRSGNVELQAFLDNVPTYMQKINKVHEAAREGNIRDLQAALDRRKFAIARDLMSPNGATPLHVATIFGKTNIIKYLGGRFPETLSAVDFEGRTALHYAAALPDNGHYYNLLQQLGANSKDLDDNGKSAEDYLNDPDLLPFDQLLSDFGISHEAARQMLSDKGTNNVENGHMDIPIFRTEEGRYLAKSLGDPLIKGLTEVANVKPKDPVAFLASFLSNFPEQEKPRLGTQESNVLVTQEPPEVENEQPPPVMPLPRSVTRTATRPHRPIDVVTIDPQADVNPDAPEPANSSAKRDEHGQSMLHFAAARSHTRNALFQIIQESDVNLAYRDELYRTARDVSIQANFKENTVDIDRWVLHLAARGNKEAIMELLMEGYDHILDVVDDEGVSITEVVAQREDPEMGSLLASIPAFEESRERLQAAIRRGDLATVRATLESPGGRTLMRARNSYGRTALHTAVLAQHEDLVEYLAQTYPELLRMGDNLERTPLHYAMGVEKLESLSRVLIRAGAKRVLKDLKGRQPSYYFMNKSDILRLKEEEEVY